MNVEQILAQFPKLSSLIVGDICLDRWCTYDPKEAEISRETGIPRIGVVAGHSTPGAAGTVANNMIALGIGRVSVMSVIGTDGYSYELLDVMKAGNIESDMIIRRSSIQTFTYTKLLNLETGEEDLPRVDAINNRPMPSDVDDELVPLFKQRAGEFDFIIVSDQAETENGGVVTPRMREALTEFAEANPQKVIWVDSRRRIEHYRGLTLKPNEDEADAACERIGKPGDYDALYQHTSARHLIVTRGPLGSVVLDPDGTRISGTRAVKNPVDICGAGDSFSAGGAATLAVTGDPVLASEFGNLVASITIMQKGTGKASPAQVLEAAAQ